MNGKTTNVLANLVEGFVRERWGEPYERLVIVGAGCSAEAGLPTGRELHQELVGANPLYSNVAAQLGESSDVERVFRVIEMLASSGRPGTEAADFARVFIGASATEAASAETAIVNITRLLRRRLWLPFEAPALPGAAEPKPSRAEYLKPLTRGQQGSTIVSLNYDNALETAEPNIVTRAPGSKRVVVPTQTTDQTRLLKLHGSLDWQRIGDDVVKSGYPLGEIDYEPAIVFGAGNKLRYYGPFLSLFEAFRQRLMYSRVVVTIGYSFRDPHVTDAVRVWAHNENMDRKKLIVGLAPGRLSLPQPVIEMDVAERLEVLPITAPASDMIRSMFVLDTDRA